MEAEMAKIELTFTQQKETKRTMLFQEELGEQGWSDQDVAVGPLYVKKQALELIGNPTKIKVTIEPI